MAGAIFELKTVEVIVPRHRAQLLNYLLLTDAAHGKIVNMRPQSIQHEFVNTSLSRTDRMAFSIDDRDWQECGNAGLKTWMTDLLRDLGVGLDLNFYRDAASHFCSPRHDFESGSSRFSRPNPRHAGTESLESRNGHSSQLPSTRTIAPISSIISADFSPIPH